MPALTAYAAALAEEYLALVPRQLVGVAQRTQKTTLFGVTYDSPFGIAPMGGTSLGCFRGDEVLARHLVHGPQHCRIADPAPAQGQQELHAADIVVARRLLGHAESPRRS